LEIEQFFKVSSPGGCFSSLDLAKFEFINTKNCVPHLKSGFAKLGFINPDLTKSEFSFACFGFSRHFLLLFSLFSMDPFFGGVFFDFGTENEELARVRRYRTRFDFDALSDREVIESFRLRRETILMLRDRIGNEVASSYANRSTDLTPLQQLIIATRLVL
jgi:hypothetical protein